MPTRHPTPGMVGLMANLMIGVDISNQDAFCCPSQLTNPRLRTLVLVGVGGPRDLIGCLRFPPPPPRCRVNTCTTTYPACASNFDPAAVCGCCRFWAASLDSTAPPQSLHLSHAIGPDSTPLDRGRFTGDPIEFQVAPEHTYHRLDCLQHQRALQVLA
jgi:hypothetical protein